MEICLLCRIGNALSPLLFAPPSSSWHLFWISSAQELCQHGTSNESDSNSAFSVGCSVDLDSAPQVFVCSRRPSLLYDCNPLLAHGPNSSTTTIISPTLLVQAKHSHSVKTLAAGKQLSMQFTIAV